MCDYTRCVVTCHVYRLTAFWHAVACPHQSQHSAALMGRKSKESWQQLDDNGCQKFPGGAQKPSVVIEKLQSWDPVKKGHCSAQLCSRGAAVVVCSGCKEELSAANYSGSWSQHSKTCQKLVRQSGFSACMRQQRQQSATGQHGAAPTHPCATGSALRQHKKMVFVKASTSWHSTEVALAHMADD
jgi:hypothetical protein